MQELMNESDPSVLSTLIWSWINQLDQPVLNEQTINILLKDCSNGLSNDHKKIPLNWKDLDKVYLKLLNVLSTKIINLLKGINLYNKLFDYNFA